MKPKAYSYRRFSSPAQGEGTSIRRQLEMSEEYARENGLELDTELQMEDEGVSAFRGANVAEGCLGAFLDEVRRGNVPRGSYLLVENFDRLTRQSIMKALGLFLEILALDIKIVTLGDGKVFEGEPEPAFEDVLLSMVTMYRAHQESQIKSERGRKAWNFKRRNTHQKKITKWCPKWLKLSADGTEFVPIKERVETLRSIFEWSVEGFGTSLIIRKLEEQGVEPWGWPDKAMNNGRQPKKWYPSYIQRLVNNRAVLGVYQYSDPNESANDLEIEDYYPRVIEEDLFYAARRARKERSVMEGRVGAGRKGQVLSNLFSGILFCGYSSGDKDVYQCEGVNEKLGLVNKGKKYRYLQCSRAKDGNIGCDDCRRMWRYDYFEQSFFKVVEDIDLSQLSGYLDGAVSRHDQIKAQIVTLEEKIEHQKKQIQKFRAAMDAADRIPEAMTQSMLNHEEIKSLLEEEYETKKEEFAVLEQEISSSRVQANSLRDLQAKMAELEGQELFDLRIRFSNILKKHVAAIYVYPSGYNVPRTKADYEAIYDFLESEHGPLTKLGKREIREAFEEEDPYQSTPFFGIVYSSGKQSIVTPNPDDPGVIDSFVSLDESGEPIVESPFLTDENHPLIAAELKKRLS